MPDGMAAVDGVILDLDGTVYRGDRLLADADVVVRRLRAAGMDVLFCTNNPTRARETYVDRLGTFGIEATAEMVLPAGHVTVRYLRREHPGEPVYLIGSHGLREQFRAAGIELVTDPEAAEILVTSHHDGFDYEALTAGLWALQSGATFVGTDPDRTYPDADGRHRPGSGAITYAVAGAASRQPDVELGKPHAITAELALERLGHPPDRTVVVGDTPETDIALGARAGAHTVLVLTGSTDRAHLPVEPTPDRVIENIAELPALLGL